MSKSKTTRPLNDQVEDIHLALYDDEQYQAFLRAAITSRPSKARSSLTTSWRQR
jgi:hypothetical protein